MISSLLNERKKTDDEKKPISNLQTYFDGLQSRVAQIQNDDPSRGDRQKLGDALYRYTKNFLEQYKNDLSPQEKGEILKEYIEVWRENNCIYDIKDTEYANTYEISVFQNMSEYNDSLPMLAGFNLENALLSNIGEPGLIFLSVNLGKANLSIAQLPDSHFENCNLSNAVVNHANFNRCRFVKCDCPKVDFSNVELDAVSFNRCNLLESNFKNNHDNNLKMTKCNLYGTVFPLPAPYKLQECIRIADFNTFKSLCNFIEAPSQNLNENDLSQAVDKIVTMLAENPSVIMYIIKSHDFIPANFLLDDLIVKMKRCGLVDKLDPLFDSCSRQILDSCIYNPYDLDRFIKLMPDRSESFIKKIIAKPYLMEKIFNEKNPETVLNQLIKKHPELQFLKVEKLLLSKNKSKRQMHDELIKLNFFQQKNAQKASYREACSENSRQGYKTFIRNSL